MRKEETTGTFTVVKKLRPRILLKIRLSWAIFPLKCGALVQWRGGANLAEKTPRWCCGAMISKVAQVAVARTEKSATRPTLILSNKAIIQIH